MSHFQKKRHRKKFASPDPDFHPLEVVEKIYYETKPALILGAAFLTAKTPLLHPGVAKISIILLMVSAAIIIFSRLEHRGVLKR